MSILKTPNNRVSNGLLSIWHGVEAGFESSLDAWYDREHHFERLAVPGFLRARRYLHLDNGSRYLSRYDVLEPSVLGTKAYLSALNHPSDWTRESMLHYRNTTRSVFRFIAESGMADGGALISLRITKNETDIFQRLDQVTLNFIVEQQGVLRIELWSLDDAISNLKSEEKNLRKAADSTVGHTVFIEGTDIDLLIEATQKYILPLLDCEPLIDRFRLVFDARHLP
jgi:hypothetical protein